ncbi:uncharacterized protein METZ01_LOCUS330846 [marine metagenome]|uniref:Uncharacterized protein n=1 Tax=marine metagenome TaxID=408172 RepID=A0A382Q0S6_9ZZZZ
METIQIHNNPNLDARMVMQVLSENLDSKYEIFSISSMWREIMIRQNSWKGVTIGLRHDGNRTDLMFSGDSPGVFPAVFTQMFIGSFIADRTFRRKILSDVREILLEIAGGSS